MSNLKAVVIRLLRDDAGQDLIEYGLLTGLIAVGSVLLFAQISAAMQGSYNNWNTASQAAWEPCAPNNGACP